MASATISTLVTIAQTIEANDTLTVTPVGSLVVSGSDAVFWSLTLGSTVPPGVVIFNEGLIQSTSDRAIDTTGATAASARSISLTNLGTITSPNDAFRIDETDNFVNGTAVVDNSGTISATGTGQGLDFADASLASSITITNQATGVIETTGADAIRVGDNTTVNNYGEISGGGADNDGIDFDAKTVSINNFAGGTITGTGHGIGGDVGLTVYNAGTITGQLGSGLNLDTPATDTALIENRGTIVGNADGATDGDGVDTDGLIDLDNYGTIQAFGTSTAGASEAITAGGGIIDNFAGGTIWSIERAINIDDGLGGGAFAATTIYNEGMIEGEDGDAVVIVGIFADTITNKGTILGAVMTAGGGDTFNLFTGSSISGLIDGGAAGDTMFLQGAGAGTLGKVWNVETVNVQGGVWTLNNELTHTGDVIVTAPAVFRVGDGTTVGSMIADADVAGRLVFDRSDSVTVAGIIAGAGVVEQAGTGTLVLDKINTYAGGTVISDGVLDVALVGAAGTGAITFASGAQTLRIESAALSPATQTSAAAPAFANAIANFGAGDVINLAGLAYGAGATTTYDGSTGQLTVSIKGQSVGLTLTNPGATLFTAESDGAGGTNIVLKDVGVAINGTRFRDVVDINSTPFGRPLPTDADDTIVGKGRNDKLAGLAGNDEIYGNSGRDFIFGNDGDDTISGGRGMNRLNGGEGFDAFLFDSKLGQGINGEQGTVFSFSRIVDFKPGVDVIELDHTIFKALQVGRLSGAEADGRAGISLADGHIKYKGGSGFLKYDADGQGGHDAVIFAKLAKNLALLESDFLVV